MSVEAAEGHLAALARLGVPAERIHIGGGEPFGDFARLLQIVRSARRAGLEGIGYVETGGHWATSESRVRTWIKDLAEAGMQQLSISADPYHQEFIPPERVRLLHEVAREVLGTRGVRARRWRWLQDPQDVSAIPEEDRRTLFRASLSRYPERMTGRAAEELAPLRERRPIPEIPPDGCREELLESRGIHVGPDGWVYPGTCAGVILGRATQDRPLDELLENWRLGDSPRMERLVEGGPRRLLDEADRIGFAPDECGYADKCHLCWSLRCHLARAGAGGDELQPEPLYQKTRTLRAKEVRQ